MAAPQQNTHPTGSSLAKDLFKDMGAQVASMNTGAEGDEEDTESKITDEVESLCMNCHENGITRLLLTKIPFFKEIVIMSFECEHCGLRNNEIQSAGEIQQKAAKYAFKVENEADLQRQVVKTDLCSFKIEELDLEIPPGKGRYTNVEGVLSSIRDDLAQHQDERMKQMPEVGAKVAEVIRGVADMVEGKRFPFMISVDDPSGNSWFEPRPGDAAGKWAKVDYNRTPAQNAALGLGDDVPTPTTHQQSTDGVTAPETEIRPEYHAEGLVGGDSLPSGGEKQGNNVDDDDIIENQVYSFPASCPGCTRPCATNMKMVNIPYFKQVIVMSTVCDDCGYRSNEVKTGGAVPEKGSRITLDVKTSEDLSRDVLKSESAALSCPELQLRVEPGTMGGRFTTVEGILENIKKDLRSQVFGLDDDDKPVAGDKGGDSMTSDSQRTWEQFFTSVEEAIAGKRPFTLVLEDPLAASYVQSFTAPEPDPQIHVEEYERTEEEMEDLGLKDIKTEGYEQDV
jgi:zinc finger protein